MTAFAEGLEVEYKKKKTRKDNPEIIDQSSNCMSVGSRVGCAEAWRGWGAGLWMSTGQVSVCVCPEEEIKSSVQTGSFRYTSGAIGQTVGYKSSDFRGRSQSWRSKCGNHHCIQGI